MNKELTPLEALEEISLLIDVRKEHINKYLNIIEKELKEGEQNKQVLEIIKEKKVDVSFIIENPDATNVFWYNSSFTGVLCEGWRMLSRKEYDLVRKALL